MSDLTYYQRKRDAILHRAKNYQENDKKRLKKESRDKCRNLSEEEKNEKRGYGKNRYHNMSEEKKQKRHVKKKQQKNKTKP